MITFRTCVNPINIDKAQEHALVLYSPGMLKANWHISVLFNQVLVFY